jgi:hypothetical protein
MALEETIRCENLSCVCEVPASEATCSPYCASPAGRDVQNVRCDCGHSVCAKAIEEQLHGEGGRESA